MPDVGEQIEIALTHGLPQAMREDEEFAERLRASRADFLRSSLVRSAQGDASLKVDGRRLHSGHDPLREAKRQAAEIQPEDGEQLLLFFGGGLGYAMARVLEEHPNPVAWIEPDIRILHAALSVHDFAEYMTSGRLVVVPAMPSDDVLDELFRGRGNRGILFIPHRASFQLHAGYDELRLTCENFLNRKDVNLATIARFDKAWARNLAANFIHMRNGRPVSTLFDTLPGGRAVICGAGPSLSDSVGTIRALKEKGFLVIAVDTAVRVLNAGDVDPDIIVSVDPQPVNRAYLEGYGGQAIFVLDPTTIYLTPRILPAERIYYTGSPFPLAEVFFRHLRVEPGDVAFGGSVFTNAYDLACLMGCERIRLFGLDLSFTGGLAHAKGAVLEERLNYLESRLFRRELHNYRQMSALPVRWLPAVGGGRTPTNDKLVIFHRWLSRRIPNDLAKGVRVVNCTPRGALLDDVPHEPEFSANEVEAMSGHWRPPRPDRDELFNANEFYADIDELSKELNEFQALLKEGIALSETILECARENRLDKKYSRLLRDMEKLDGRVQEKLRASQVVGAVMQKIILRITEDFGAPASDGSTENRDLKLAEQTHLLYTGMGEACESQIRRLDKALRVHALAQREA